MPAFPKEAQKASQECWDIIDRLDEMGLLPNIDVMAARLGYSKAKYWNNARKARANIPEDKRRQIHLINQMIISQSLYEKPEPELKPVPTVEEITVFQRAETQKTPVAVFDYLISYSNNNIREGHGFPSAEAAMYDALEAMES